MNFGSVLARRALIGRDAELAARFEHGQFATLYLSPRDYHRIHMPCDARLLRMIHVPGALFSVNPTTARGVPGLFARNERVVCVFDSAVGPLVLLASYEPCVPGRRDPLIRYLRHDRAGRVLTDVMLERASAAP